MNDPGFPPAEDIELSSPDVTEDDIEAVAAVLRTRWLSLGPKLAEFEQAVAELVGRRWGVAVNSGTSALHLIVRALGLRDGDEVITTPYSFIASANCLLYERAVPKFVDVDPTTLNLDPESVEEAITARTKAVLGVDVFGLPADWPRLEEIAERHSLALIEDSCEALGARRRTQDGGWQCAGSFGEAAAFAFYPNKQITTGEGGVIVTDDDELAQVCRSLRNQGRNNNGEWVEHARLGYNYRISDMNCALGLAQMKRLDEMLASRRAVATWYAESLGDYPAVALPAELADCERSWFVYVVRLLGCPTREALRDVMGKLRAQGIACSNYFPCIHLQPFYRELFGYREGDFPVAERVSAQSLALPFSSRLSRERVRRVADTLREVLQQLGLDATSRVRGAED
ncbi:MAG: DegT/DnrJ/EryC1/StrS family aminotransferase [Armatimonadetes bacterium]|nr:DegT/DnrJ/EryC1/StrS family aminotransferase [Armatimonadota bacterium]